MEEVKGVLRVRGKRVQCNNQGYPLKDDFLRLLLPDPAGKGERIKVQKGDHGPDYIEDLDVYITRVARKIGTFEEDVRENISYEEEKREEVGLLENTQVVHALGLVLSSIDQEREQDFAIYLKDTALPFIKAIRKHGPVAAEPTKESHDGGPLFGVSQRIEQLGLSDVIGSNFVPVIGMRALELYKQVYPGHTPPQRIIRNEKHDKQYMMNLYTEATAAKTLDVAIKEQKAKVSRKKRKIN